MWKANKKRSGKKAIMFWHRWGFCFSRGKTCVTKQIKDAWAPFSMGVHCVAHYINLVVQSLSNLTLFAQLKVFMENLHSYFSLSKITFRISKIYCYHGNQGNKIFKNVKTHFMSMFDPLKRIMANYKPLLVIMQADQISTQMAKVSVIQFSIICSILCDFSL
jgi:hypothetical protein